MALVHAERLLAFAMKCCADPARAEDLVQETLLSAWANFHQFEIGTNCRAWLFKILVNLRNKDANRRRSSPESVRIDDERTEFGAPEKVSDTTAIRVALDSLSAEHRDILRLGVLEGFSIEELSDQLSIPPGTVMSRLSRARARLRAMLTSRDPAQAVA